MLCNESWNFPQRCVVAAILAQPDIWMCANEPGQPYGSDKRSLRILCVEDDPMMGRILVRLLREAGHLVELAPDGQAAWEKLLGNFGTIDLLITDHDMPELTGLELVQQLRGAGFPGRIIVHANALSDATLADYGELAVDRLVPKASGKDELLHAIESVFGAD
jgi:CheY-like chemotaxis protein